MFDGLYAEPGSDAARHVTGGRLRGRDAGTVTIPKATRTVKGPETSWSYFHPGRIDAVFAPAAFRAQVHAIDPNLDVVQHPIHERWCVWVKNPRVTHWMCPGWQLLFPVRYADGSFMPLDARTLAMIYDRSPRKWGNARRYFDRIVEEVRHDYEAGQATRAAVVGQVARDQWKHAQIQVGYGPSNGSKFSQHHAGG